MCDLLSFVGVYIISVIFNLQVLCRKNIKHVEY
jgi:hypothetical protein